MTHKNLRDTIRHSFVSCDIGVCDEPVIVFDDRIILSKAEHNKLSETCFGTQCVCVKSSDVLAFLKKAFSKLKQYLKTIEMKRKIIFNLLVIYRIVCR